jgi:hypothetical protein
MAGGFDRIYVLKSSPCPNVVASFFLYCVLALVVYSIVVLGPIAYSKLLYRSSMIDKQAGKEGVAWAAYGVYAPYIRDVSRPMRVVLLLCCIIQVVQLLYILIFPPFLFNAVFSAQRGAPPSSMGQFYSHSVNWGPVNQGVTLVLLMIYVSMVSHVLRQIMDSLLPIVFLVENLFT